MPATCRARGLLEPSQPRTQRRFHPVGNERRSHDSPCRGTIFLDLPGPSWPRTIAIDRPKRMRTAEGSCGAWRPGAFEWVVDPSVGNMS